MAGAASFPIDIVPLHFQSCPLQEIGIVPPFVLGDKIGPPVHYDSDT